MGIALRELQHCNNCNSFLSRYSGMKKISQKNEKFLVKYS